MSKNYSIFEYIWIDADGDLRSKTRIFYSNDLTYTHNLPIWNFDGSSTKQATGNSSDVFLHPKFVCPDPFRKNKHTYLVLCDLYDSNGKPHSTNTRVECVEIEKLAKEHQPWFGIEQEYIVYDAKTNKPYKWLDFQNYNDGNDAIPSMLHQEQGPFYCSVGADRNFCRNIMEEHMLCCIEAGLHIRGTNTEVCPSQNEYQIGELGLVDIGDQLWMSRYILKRVCENYGCYPVLHPKPMAKWNGSGAHTNFSTKKIREENQVCGPATIEACEKLKNRHKEHIAVYGNPEENKLRLTGIHETANIDVFTYGEADRGASVRLHSSYKEDRRPPANCDPYLVCTRIVKTICLDM